MKIEKLKLGKIKPNELKIFKTFLPEEYHPYLFGRLPKKIPHIKISGYAAYNDNDEPIGIVIGNFNIPIKLSELNYLYVDPSYRGQKVAAQLLEQLKKGQKKLGSGSISVNYQTKQSYTDLLESFLNGTGWSKPKLFLLKLYFLSAEFHPNWLDFKPKLPPGMTVFLWKDLTLEERERLEHLHRELSFPVYVSPLSKNFEPANSLGLRYNGEIVGWMFTRRETFKKKDDTVNYAAFFTRPEFQFIGPSMKLLIESIKLHIEAQIPYGLMELNLLNIDQKYYEFVLKRYKPYSIHIDEFYTSWIYT